ncbi:MAG: class I SAM-dependent methyltransferase [Candidatus Aenigmatarchaeota archaeon]
MTLQSCDPPFIFFTHPGIVKILSLVPKDINSLLDLGCGRGIIGILVRIYRSPKRVVGVEIFKKYINFCKKHRIYDKIFKLDLKKLPLPFKNKSFDVVTLIEVIEHLPKENAINLIFEAERIAKKKSYNFNTKRY